VGRVKYCGLGFVLGDMLFDKVRDWVVVIIMCRN